MAVVGGRRDPPVLIVDDDATVRVAVSQALGAKLPCDLHDFSTARDALSAAAGIEFGLAVLDVDLGATTGIDLAKQLRASQPDLPIVFLTGSSDETVAADLARFGAAAVLRKPVDSATLVQTAEKHRRRGS